MATQTFSWNPDEGGSEDTKPDVVSTKFGDGYEQRTKKGINPNAISWSLKFTGNAAYATPIRNFLLARDGAEAFIWVNPYSESGMYVCRQWVATRISPSVIEISAKFERVYEAVI